MLARCGRLGARAEPRLGSPRLAAGRPRSGARHSRGRRRSGLAAARSRPVVSLAGRRVLHRGLRRARVSACCSRCACRTRPGAVVALDSVVVTGAGATVAWALLVEPHLERVVTSPWTGVRRGDDVRRAHPRSGSPSARRRSCASVTAAIGVRLRGRRDPARRPSRSPPIGGDGAPYARGGLVDCFVAGRRGPLRRRRAASFDGDPRRRRARPRLASLTRLARRARLARPRSRDRCSRSSRSAAGTSACWPRSRSPSLLVVLVVLRLGDVLELQKIAIEREHVMGAGAARLAAVRSHDELEEVATETARGLVGRDAWVVFGDKPLPAAALEGRRFAIVINGVRVGEIAVSAGRLAPDNVRSLERLSSQVARAIEGVKLIEQRAAGRSEARFRSLVQNSSDLIAVLDAARRVHVPGAVGAVRSRLRGRGADRAPSSPSCCTPRSGPRSRRRSPPRHARPATARSSSACGGETAPGAGSRPSSATCSPIRASAGSSSPVTTSPSAASSRSSSRTRPSTIR